MDKSSIACTQRARVGWKEIRRMKSVLIKDTTKSERIAIIKEWIPVDDGLEDCEIDMWEMYRDYINGEKEIAQINEEFSKRMFG